MFVVSCGTGHGSGYTVMCILGPGSCMPYTVHVTLTRHSCMWAFSTWMKSIGQNNHGFLSRQFCRELNLEQNGQDQFF